MGKFLEIADRALDEITENQTVKESESKSDPSTQCEISELSEISPEDDAGPALEPPPRIDWGESPLVHSVDKRSKELRESADELRWVAEDDWDEVSNDPAQLVAFADSLAIVQIRESGGIPDNYTSTTECKNCRTVPIWQGCPPQVDGCPWCFNRHKGLPMPDTANQEQ